MSAGDARIFWNLMFPGVIPSHDALAEPKRTSGLSSVTTEILAIKKL